MTPKKEPILQRVLIGNMAAGASGKLWRILIQFITIPLFIGMLGPEAYGLVAFNVTLLTFLVFLDQGVSPVLVREFGRMGGETEHREAMRDLLRSMEVVSYAIAFVIGVAIFALAPYIAQDWLKAPGLPMATVQMAVQLMGLTIAFQWPSFLYSSGYVALHRQGQLAKINIIFACLQYGGALLVLYFVARDIRLFLAWQAFCALGMTAVLGVVLWRGLPISIRAPRFSASTLRGIAQFAGGTLLIGIVSSLLTQTGNLVVSKYFPLDQFTAYAMSFMLASQVFALFIISVSAPILPYLSKLMSQNDSELLAQEYHRWTQIIVFIAVVVMGPIAAFPQPLLQLWLGIDSPLIAPMSALLPWVIAGSILSAAVSMPFMLQMAAGQTRLTIMTNLVAIVVFVLGLLYVLPRYGIVAGAVGWAVLNLGYYLLFSPLAHRRILPSVFLRWWGFDVFVPLALGTLIYGGMKMILPVYQSPLLGFGQAALSSLVVAGILTLCLPAVRAMAATGLHKTKILLGR